MRLIDADPLYESIMSLDEEISRADVLALIENAPTVLEEEQQG
jgi:hypothetical protein